MARNLNVALWLFCGTIAISSAFLPDASLALKIDATQGQTAIEMNASASRQYQQGLAALEAGDTATAIASFDRAIALDPQYFPAYIERGNVKDSLGDFSGAAADYTIAISLDSRSAAAYYNRGTVLSKSGNHQAAVADYNLAIGIDPNYAQAYMNRGNELDDLGNFAGAIASYDRAVAIDPNYALAYLNRGIAYGRAGDRDFPQGTLRERAIADLQVAAKLFEQTGNLDRYERALKMISNLRPVY
ncbi:tetratricopeptide repeat protein [Chamaesiphon sp. OTE_20_metabat_361]|uniref:tetratricopeptide repeat protein n=1 Tax=Chamaesiphon sp. OTE_20_metabat_361 TaxID=2964689 RepID=UPI00286AFA81|nr:tetratricopeptide repeat protein [Chamaesiphon sp. OTE_20_metabat_361]